MDREKVIFVFLAILTLIAIGVVLEAAKSVILPLIIAWLLTYLLAPVVNVMTKRKIPRSIAIFVVIVLLFGVGYVAAIFLHARVTAVTDAFPRYHQRVTELGTTLSNFMDLKYNPLASFDWGETVSGLLVKLSGSLISVLTNLVLVIIFLVFLLLGHPYLRFKIKHALSVDNADRIIHVFTSISSQISRYLSVQFLISFLTGVLIWFALTLIGVDFAVTWGALAFFLNFIPTIGSILASIPPILLALVQFYPNFWPAVITLIVVMAIQLLIGNGVTPKVMGDRLNLSPVVVLLSLLFWGWLWGVVGAILSIPIASAIKIVCENIEELQPISVMMGSGKRYRNEFPGDVPE